MLVLSRKSGESIVVDGNIHITVTKVVGNRVTIGVDAPKDVRIRRGELPDHTAMSLNAAMPTTFVSAHA